MPSYEDRMLRVLAHIHDNPAGDLSLDALADIAAMSRFHWHRVFRAMTGETCAQAVRRVRLHRAASLLVESDLPVAEVARTVGLHNVQSFTRIFKTAYGLTPAAFRDRGATPAPLHSPASGDHRMYPIDIETHPARRLAAMPHHGAYTAIGKAFESLGQILSARNLWSQTRDLVGVYHDDPEAVPEDSLRSHAGAILSGDVSVTAPLEEVLLPAGRYAVMHHSGPYAGLAAAYRWMYGTWLPQSGEVPGDHPAIEIYLNGPMDTAPDELRTDVCLPLNG